MVNRDNGILCSITTYGFRDNNDAAIRIISIVCNHCCFTRIVYFVIYAVNLNIVGERYSREYGQANDRKQLFSYIIHGYVLRY